MVSIWYLPVLLCVGFISGFCFYGCIDWKNDNWGK